MTYLLRYTPEAVHDMDDLWEDVYETSESPDIADQQVEEFAEAIAAKKQFPLSGIPLVYRGLFTGFYSVTCKRYKAFYRIKEKYIEVIRIITAKRDYMTVLFGETDE